MKWEETWYSDAIKYVGYDMYHDKLAVVFNSSDNVYIYSGVKGDVAKQLQSADSIGSYYNENIKGKFPSEKIPDSESFIAKSIFQIQ